MVFGTYLLNIKEEKNVKLKKKKTERDQRKGMDGSSTGAVLSHIRAKKNLVNRPCCLPSERWWPRLTAVAWRGGEEELGAGQPERQPLLRTCRISAEIPEESHSCHFNLVMLSCAALLETAEGSSKIWLRRTPPLDESRWQNIPGGGEAWPGSRAGEVHEALIALGGFF